MYVPQIHRELRRERTGGELREGQAIEIVLPADPATLVDQVSLHEAGKRDRTAESGRT